MKKYWISCLLVALMISFFQQKFFVPQTTLNSKFTQKRKCQNEIAICVI